MRQKILILGSTGFIGTNLFNLLSKSDNYDIYTTFHIRKTPFHNVNHQYLDLFNLPTNTNIFDGFDTVIQCAAITGGIKDASLRSCAYLTRNAIINSLIFEQLFESNVKHFIFLSCSVMYHDSIFPLREIDFDADKIDSNYFGGAWNKIYFEKICEYFSRFNRIRFTVIRHSNCYGPWDNFDLSSGHAIAANVVKIAKAAKNEVITIWGQGEEKRDFLFVEDLCQFLKLVINNCPHKFEIYNIGSGQMISINETVKLIIQISGKKLETSHDLSQPSNPVSFCLDCTKAKNDFNWVPKTNILDGLKISYQWFVDHSV